MGNPPHMEIPQPPEGPDAPTEPDPSPDGDD